MDSSGITTTDEDALNVPSVGSKAVKKAQNIINTAEDQLESAEYVEADAMEQIDTAEAMEEDAKDKLGDAGEELGSYFERHDKLSVGNKLLTENMHANGPVVRMGEEVGEDEMNEFCEMLNPESYGMADTLKGITGSERIYKENVDCDTEDPDMLKESGCDDEDKEVIEEESKCCPTCECDPCECDENCEQFNESAFIKEATDIWANASGASNPAAKYDPETGEKLTEQQLDEMEKEENAQDLGELPIDGEGNVDEDLDDSLGYDYGEDDILGMDSGSIEMGGYSDDLAGTELVDEFEMEDDDFNLSSLDDDFEDDDLTDLGDNDPLV